MVPRLIKLLEDALKEARGRRVELGLSLSDVQGACLTERRTWIKHASITVTHLEDALMRARLSFGIGESV